MTVWTDKRRMLLQILRQRIVTTISATSAVITQSGEGARTYTYAYKDNAARDLESITTGVCKFSPQTDKLGRNAGREISNNADKVAGEYIYYRKVGDHATNMPSSVRYGRKQGDKFLIVEGAEIRLR